jgi:hypothetical protein
MRGSISLGELVLAFQHRLSSNRAGIILNPRMHRISSPGAVVQSVSLISILYEFSHVLLSDMLGMDRLAACKFRIPFPSLFGGSSALRISSVFNAEILIS